MSDKGVHYLAYSSVKARLEKNAREIEEASISLQEAIKMGDLRENAEYDAAKDAMSKLTKEKDMLSPVLTMPVIRSSDNISIFEEGSVIYIEVYGTMEEPVEPKSEAFKKIVAGDPLFKGTVMLGGTIMTQDLLTDAALDAETPVGSYLLGKQSGSYCISVPGGFVPVIAKKLKSTEFTPDDLGCEYYGT